MNRRNSDVVHDILKHLSTMVPNSREFLHSEGNSDAHIKSTLVGCSVEIPVQEGLWLSVSGKASSFANLMALVIAK